MKRIVFACLISGILSGCTVKSGSSDPLVQTLLDEDWSTAYSYFMKDYADSVTSVYKIIKGHVLLANNKLYDALDIFMFLGEEDKSSWLKWTEENYALYSENPVMAYFYADAICRNGDFEKASMIFNSTPINGSSTSGLLMNNAQAIAQYKQNESSESFTGFLNTSATYDTLADIHNTIGIIRLKKQLATAKAEQAFDKSMELCHRNPQALTGLLQILLISDSPDQRAAINEKINNYISEYQLDTFYFDLMFAELTMFKDLINIDSVGSYIDVHSYALDQSRDFQNIIDQTKNVFDPQQAKREYAIMSENAIASATQDNWILKGLQATCLDIIGGYIPGEAENRGQQLASVGWALTGSLGGWAAGLDIGRTMVSASINASNGDYLGTANDMLSLYGKFSEIKADRLFQTSIPGNDNQYTLSFMDDKITDVAESYKRGADYISRYGQLKTGYDLVNLPWDEVHNDIKKAGGVDLDLSHTLELNQETASNILPIFTLCY